MTIGERLKHQDINTYNKLMQLCKKKYKEEPFAKVEIKLGDSIENLMGHDSYRRTRGRIRQR